MQVSVEAGDGLTRRLRVELPADEIEQEVESRLKSYARTARLPGFRPGKVPLKLVRQRFGESVRMEVFGAQVESTYPQAVAESELRPAGRPSIEPDLDQSTGRYGYVAEFEVMPELVLASLEGRSVKRPVVEVTEADVDDMIQRLREQRKRWETVDRAAAEGDLVKIDFEGRVDGELFDGGKGEGMAIELGSGRAIPGFEEQLVGATAGEERTLELTFPEDYQQESLAGKPAVFQVVVQEVQQSVLPEVDAAFLTEFGVEDGDQDRFRADVRSNLERECGQRVRARVKDQVLEALVEAHEVPLPSALIADEIATLREQAMQNLGGVKIDIPDEVFSDNARRRVALGLIVAEVVKQHELSPSDEQVRETLEQMAAAYDDPQAVIDYHYADRQRLAAIESLVLEDLVVEKLLEQLQVEEDPISFTELTSDR